MRRKYDCIVIGCGGLGSAAVYWLSRRCRVLGIEQFETGHVRGGSQDHSRIIRLAYDAPQFAALAPYTYMAYRHVEAESGLQLVLRTGGLVLGDLETRFGPTIESYAATMRGQAVPFEELTAAEAMARWPQFRLPESVRVLYQAETGLVDAARTNAAHLALARARGADIVDGAPVLDLRVTADGVEVSTARGEFAADRVVITAGAWLNQVLAPLGARFPIKVTKQQVTYFATPHLRAFMPDRFPVWMYRGDENFYGFPIYGEVATKAAQTKLDDEVDPNSRTFEPNETALERLQAFLAARIPDALGPILYTKTCLYDATPDENFILDSLPGCPQVIVGNGAAHGFKFAGLIGKILSELALDGRTEHPIEAFKADRPALAAGMTAGA